MRLGFVKGALAAGVGLAFASVASAQYNGPWNHTWDFNNGTQGWSITGGGYHYNSGGSGPVLPDGSPSGYGSGSLHLTDSSYARINIADFTSTQLGANGNVHTGKQGFVLQADAWLPNLRPLSGFPSNAPGNALSSSGVGVEGTNVALYLEGRTSTNLRGLTARDFGWDNVARNRSNTLNQTGIVSPDSLWWDAIITLQIDYNFTTPGKWSAWAYIPFQSTVGPAGWYAMDPGAGGAFNVHPGGSAATFLQLGGQFSWTQAQFDNVKLAYVPEPATLGLLAFGGLLLRRRRMA